MVCTGTSGVSVNVSGCSWTVIPYTPYRIAYVGHRHGPQPHGTARHMID